MRPATSGLPRVCRLPHRSLLGALLMAALLHDLPPARAQVPRGGPTAAGAGAPAAGGSAAPQPQLEAPTRPPTQVERARQHFERAERHYSQGRFSQAIADYEAAYEASAMPQLLFNLAQCHRNLGNHELAIFFFRKYLRLQPHAEDREQIAFTIGQLETALAEAAKHRQRATLTAAPTRAAAPRASAPARRREARQGGHARLWLVSGVAAALGAGVLTLALWPDGGPRGDLGSIDLDLTRR